MVTVIVKSCVGPVSGASVFSAKLQLPTRYRQASQRRSLRVQSRSTSGGPEDPRQTDLLQQLRAEATRFTERYDVLSTGAGALVCTSYFWARGQDPIEALWITFCATIAGLVLNELMFKGDN